MFRKPNYTQTPNEFFDELLPTLKEGELRVLLVIMRQTFGWKKKWDQISFGQLERLTGMSRSAVIDSSKSLEDKKIIYIHQQGENGNVKTYYCLQVENEKSEFEEPHSSDSIDDSKKFYQSSKTTGSLKLPTKERVPNSSYVNKKDKNCNVPPPKKEEDVPAQLSKLMFSKIKELHPKARKPNYAIWNREFERLIRIDKRNIQEINQMIEWIYNHDFWFKNILSPDKLRKQWDRLSLQINQVTNQGSRIKQNREIAFTAKNALKRAGSGSEMMILQDRVVHAMTNQFTTLDQDTEHFISQITNIFNLERK